MYFVICILYFNYISAVFCVVVKYNLLSNTIKPLSCLVNFQIQTQTVKSQLIIPQQMKASMLMHDAARLSGPPGA